MQRVLVMGSSGSGKSTFARRLSDYLQGLRADHAPVCSTDRAQANDYLKSIALKQNRASTR